MKIKHNVPRSPEEKVRKKWSFQTMKVDSVLDVQKEYWPAAARAAHGYASIQDPKWKFSTQWLTELKVGRIRRLK